MLSLSGSVNGQQCLQGVDPILPGHFRWFVFINAVCERLNLHSKLCRWRPIEELDLAKAVPVTKKQVIRIVKDTQVTPCSIYTDTARVGMPGMWI